MAGGKKDGESEGEKERDGEGEGMCFFCFFSPRHNISRFASRKLDGRGSVGVSWEIKRPHMGVLVT